MRNAASIQLMGGNNSSSKQRKVVVTSALWTVQGLLALLFLFAGSTKLMIPVEMLTAQMSVPLPGWFMQFIGIAEVAGALGLILPGLLRIQRILTPLAACGLVIIMIGATLVTLIGGDATSALIPLAVGILCVLIAYSRRTYFTTA